MGPECCRCLHRFQPVIGRAGVVAHRPQHYRQAVGGVSEVVHHKYPALVNAADLFGISVLATV